MSLSHHKRNQHDCHATIQIPHVQQQAISSKSCTCNKMMCIPTFYCNASTKNNAPSKDLCKLVNELQEAFNEQTNKMKSQIQKLTIINNENIKNKDSEIASLMKKIGKLQDSLEQQKQRNKKIAADLEKAQKEKDIIFKAKIAENRRGEIVYQTQVNNLRAKLADSTLQLEQYQQKLKLVNTLNQESLLKTENAFRAYNQDIQKLNEFNKQLIKQNQLLKTERGLKEKELLSLIIDKEDKLSIRMLEYEKIIGQLLNKSQAYEILKEEKQTLNKKLIDMEKIFFASDKRLKDILLQNSCLINDNNKLHIQITYLKNQNKAQSEIILSKQNQVNRCRNQVNHLISSNKRILVHKPILRNLQVCHQCNAQIFKRQKSRSRSRSPKRETNRQSENYPHLHQRVQIIENQQ